MSNKPIKNVQGFSLVELMVAMVLGLVLIAGVVQVVVSNIQTFNATNGIARVQENARFAIGELSRELREVGFRGCIAAVPNLAFAADAIYDFTSADIVPHTVAAGSNSITVGTSTISGVIENTQAVTLKKLVDVSAQVATDSSGTILNASSASSISANDVLYVGDCEKSDVVDVGTVNGNAVTLLDPLSGTYKPGAAIYKVEVATYYIGESVYTSASSGATVNALFKKVYGETAQELVVGVNDLQFLFGVDNVASDNSSAPTQFLGSTTDANSVRVVRALLTTTSIDPVNGQELTRDFTVSVSLRNRLASGV